MKSFRVRHSKMKVQTRFWGKNSIDYENPKLKGEYPELFHSWVSTLEQKNGPKIVIFGSVFRAETRRLFFKAIMIVRILTWFRPH